MLLVRKPIFWLTLGLNLVTASMASAAGGGNGDSHKINWFDLPGITDGFSLNDSIHNPALFWLFVTFGIYVAIIGWVMYKKLPGFLAQRSELIRKAIEEASQVKKEAEENARAYEERMAKLDEEIKQLREDFASQGQAEFERVEKSAEIAAAKIQKDTEATIDAELQKAVAEIQSETAKLAYGLATEHLEKSLTAEDQTRLEDAFLEDLNRQAQA